MSTALHQRMLAFDQGDAERSELMRKVWAPTPWMVDAYTGNEPGQGRDREMLHWCHDEFGQMCSPIHQRDGRWQRGSATVYGWTWFGFAEEAELQRFLARWPTPEGIAGPST
jgi:hypothetical protein